MAVSDIQVVLFDLGGVLVRICRSWAEGCRQAKIPVRDPEWLGSQAARARRHAAVAAYQIGALTFAEYAARLVEALGGRYDASEVTRVHDAWLIDEYAGVSALVERLLREGRVTTGCLSNTNARHWQRIAPGTPRPEFPACAALRLGFASHELNVSKPDPRIYGLVTRALSVQPPQILFFDDGEENVEAARTVGWRAELVDYGGDTAAQLCTGLRSHGVLN